MDLSDRDALANRFERTGDIIENVLTDSNNNPLDIDGLVSKANKTYGMDVKKEDLFSKGTNVLSQSEISKLAKDMADAEAQRIADAQEARKTFEDYSRDTSKDEQVEADLIQAGAEAVKSSPFSVPQDDSGDDVGSGMGGGDSGDTSGFTDDAGYGVGAKGGFFSKSKMTKQKPKVKKMKRGGLASR